MNHEQDPQPAALEHEQTAERPQIFDIGNMSPGQVEALVGGLGFASRNSELGSGQLRAYDALLIVVAHDARHAIEADPAKGVEVFSKLIESRNSSAREFALYEMASELVQRLPFESPSRQWLIDQWVAQLEAGEDEFDADGQKEDEYVAGAEPVREAASRSLSMAIDKQLDLPTADYLYDRVQAIPSEYDRKWRRPSEWR